LKRQQKEPSDSGVNCTGNYYPVKSEIVLPVSLAGDIALTVCVWVIIFIG